MEEIKNKNGFAARFALSYLIMPMLPVTGILIVLLLISLLVRGFKQEHVLSLIITFILLNVVWLLLLFIFGLIIKKLQYYKGETSKIMIASFPIGKEKNIIYDDIKEVSYKKRFLLYKLKVIGNKKAVLLFSSLDDLKEFLKKSTLEAYLNENEKVA